MKDEARKAKCRNMSKFSFLKSKKVFLRFFSNIQRGQRRDVVEPLSKIPRTPEDLCLLNWEKY